jgi:uncharacterized membrane-anchored protein
MKNIDTYCCHQLRTGYVLLIDDSNQSTVSSLLYCQIRQSAVRYCLMSRMTLDILGIVIFSMTMCCTIVNRLRTDRDERGHMSKLVYHYELDTAIWLQLYAIYCTCSRYDSASVFRVD